MSAFDLLRDPMLRHAVLVLWLLPCAIQDRRTRHVSNWLTVPLFLLAWPASLLLDTFPLTLAVFVGVYVAYRFGGGMGPADGKIAVGLAGMLPLALLMSFALQAVAFLVCRLRGETDARLPGAVAFLLGTVLAALGGVAALLTG